MSKLINASICFTDLMDLAKKPHSAFTRAKNNKAYVSLQIWVNDEPDKYDHDVSIMMNSTQKSKDVEGKVYVGNGKTVNFDKPQPQKAEQFNESEKFDDLPF